jgi:hypothetical protein
MVAIDRFQRRWLVVFGCTLAVLVLAAVWLYLRLPSFRDPPVNFQAMGSDEIFNDHGLTRRQTGSLKLGFAEMYPGPAIGAYGNHVIQYFGSEAFDRPPDPAYFFNYSYANLALPEIYSLLLHVEKRGHLPRRLLLVQVTSPNNDNGHYIVNWGNELPPDIILNTLTRDSPGDIRQTLEIVWQLVRNELQEILNYNTFILSLLQGRRADRIVSPALCGTETPAWMLRMPNLLRNIVGPYIGRNFYCMRRNWQVALRRDGSSRLPDPEDEDPSAKPIRNQNPLKDSDRALNAGDEHKIVRYLRAIDALGRRNGIRVIFIVPPVYESDRSDSVVNQIFDRALVLAPEIAVVDNRHLHSDASLFRDYNHPSPQYYRLVVDELRSRGVFD